MMGFLKTMHELFKFCDVVCGCFYGDGSLDSVSLRLIRLQNTPKPPDCIDM
jgi:hypothetical protein